MAYLYHADALLYWRMNNMHANYPARDAWNEQWNFTGNGDGTLLYPGRPGVHGLESHQPILSLRAKAIEEALNDVWYYRQMDKLPNKPAWWSTAIHELVRSPTSWDKDYSKYQDLLERVGNYLNENAP